MEPALQALVELGGLLRREGYAFTSITPSSHARVNARRHNALARSVRDVFGWSRPFEPGRQIIADPLLERMREAGILLEEKGLLRSAVRFSTLGELLLVHSAFPTLEAGAVFFGPDTYRFAAVLRREVAGTRRVVDIGCGTGAGGLTLLSAGLADEQVVLADINAQALRFASVNAALNGFPPAKLQIVLSDVLAGVEGPFDCVIANPPFLVDAGRRAYRHGGERGIALSRRIAAEALERLPPGGRLVLYTASPIVDGRDLLQEALSPLLPQTLTHTYQELDPDVFGEELDADAYEDVERLALVSFVAIRR